MLESQEGNSARRCSIFLAPHLLPGDKGPHSRGAWWPWQCRQVWNSPVQSPREHQQRSAFWDILPPKDVSVSDITQWGHQPQLRSSLHRRRLHLWEVIQARLNSTIIDLGCRFLPLEASFRCHQLTTPSLTISYRQPNDSV